MPRLCRQYFSTIAAQVLPNMLTSCKTRNKMCIHNEGLKVHGGTLWLDAAFQIALLSTAKVKLGACAMAVQLHIEKL